MTATPTSISNTSHFQIHFRSLLLQGGTVAFPCDDHGTVDMDRLSEAGLREYLFARIMTRLDHLRPEVVQSSASESAAASLVY